MTLKDIVTEGKVSRPPRLILYSFEGFGKSSFGASALKPICLQTEDGLDEIGMPRFPKPETFDEAMGYLKTLYDEDHDYKTVVIDTVDWLEPLIWKHTCEVHGKGNIEDFGYGKGFTFALDGWTRLLSALDRLRNEKGMAVLLLAHAEVKRFDSPDVEPYDRYKMKLHKSVEAKITEWCDAVIFANYKIYTEKTDVGFNKKVIRGTGACERFMYTEERPAYKAKNRYSLPDELPFIKGEAWNTLMKCIKDSRATTKPKTKKEEVEQDG